MALVVSLAGFATAIALAVVGSAVVGGLFGGTTLASLVGIFIYGSRQQRRERQEKAEQFVS